MHFELRRDYKKIEQTLRAATERISAADSRNPHALEILAREHVLLQDLAYVRQVKPSLSFEKTIVQEANKVFLLLESKLREGLTHARHTLMHARAPDTALIRNSYELVRKNLPDVVLEQFFCSQDAVSSDINLLTSYRAEIADLLQERHLLPSRQLHERLARISQILREVSRQPDRVGQALAHGIAVYVEDSILRMKKDLREHASFALLNYPTSLGRGRKTLRSEELTYLHIADCVAIEQQLNGLLQDAREVNSPQVLFEDRLMIGFRCDKNCDDIASKLEGYGEVERFSLIPYIALRTDESTAQELMRKPRALFGRRAVNIYKPFTHQVITMHAPKAAHSWNLELVCAQDAWSRTRGEGSLVAIVDTGIDYRHADLSERFGEERGIGFVSGDCYDDNGHGTHVAGTVAGVKTGVAPGCQLYAVKVLDLYGSGSEVDVLKGIEWSITHGAQVINMSLGSSYASVAEEELIAVANKRGVAVCCAAGNDGDSGYNYPASHEGAISVAAINKDKRHAQFSNHNDQVDLAAPGVGIYSTWPGGNYENLNGTSMATPHVAGACALAIAAGIRSPEDALKRTAEQLGDQEYFGAGLINCGKAIK